MGLVLQLSQWFYYYGVLCGNTVGSLAAHMYALRPEIIDGALWYGFSCGRVAGELGYSLLM